MTHQYLRAGFTLAEMILVVAIISILLGVSTPSIYQFMKQRDIQQEENTLQEMRRALQAYLADKNALPQLDNPATPEVEWAIDLAGYTNLSAAEMALDTWDENRVYVNYVDSTRNIQGSSVAINYVTFMSSGPDKVAAASTGVAIDGTKFAAPTDPDWWAITGTPAQRTSLFGQLASADDDLMTKFTDYAEKLDRYNLTLQRMDRIANAVESLARLRYGEEVSACAGLPRNSSGQTGIPKCDIPGALEQVVYYPIGTPSNLDGWNINLHRYQEIYNAGAVAVDDQVNVRNGQPDNVRRQDMIKLMRLLGLSDDFCCSALEMGTDGEPKPFYYFSNPRPRGISANCGTRPDLATQKLPARLSTINDDSASPPTCG